jgi:hypothetical protein
VAIGKVLNTGAFNNVRVFSDQGKTQICSLNKGATIDVLRVENGFASFRLMAGDTPVSLPRTTTPGEFWIAANTVVYEQVDPPPPPPPPPPPTGNVIGKHPALPVLARHEMLGLHFLELGKPEIDAYLNAGCRSFTCMNNVNAAREARERGPVIFRKYIDHGNVPDPRQHVLSMGLHPSDRLMVMGVNEGDNISVDDIERRFEWDKKFAEAVWELLPNCFPVIGSLSMGTCKIEDAGVAKRWRDTYGKFLNANWHRVGFNYHSYSARPADKYPPAWATVIGETWLAMRWLVFGYDPLYGGLDKRVILVSDESGVDQPGTGGFRDCGYTDQQVEMWIAERLGLFAAYPQMYAFNLFQADWRNKRWAGYNIRQFLSVLERAWRGEIKPSSALVGRFAALREVILSSTEVFGGGIEQSPLASNWSPEPKRHE